MGHLPADADKSLLPTTRTVRERQERCVVVRVGYTRIVRRLSVVPLNLIRTTKWNIRVGPPYQNEIVIRDQDRFIQAARACLTGRPGLVEGYLADWPAVDKPVSKVRELVGVEGGIEFLLHQSDG
jgi:hypothetical protein